MPTPVASPPTSPTPQPEAPPISEGTTDTGAIATYVAYRSARSTAYISANADYGTITTYVTDGTASSIADSEGTADTIASDANTCRAADGTDFRRAFIDADLITSGREGESLLIVFTAEHILKTIERDWTGMPTVVSQNLQYIRLRACVGACSNCCGARAQTHNRFVFINQR